MQWVEQRLPKRYVYVLETMNVTSFEKKKNVFADAIKDLDMRRSFWVTSVDLKSSDQGPYKKRRLRRIPC